MFNKVILVGNLTRDIELRYSQSGMGIAKTGLATSRRFTSNGEKKEEVCFIDVTFFGRSAEIANQYLRKGSKILVEGRLNFEQWVDQNGGKRSKHSVTVENMQMLDSRADAQSMGAPMDQGGYDAPSYQQESYSQPQHGGYNAPQQQYQQPQQQYQQPQQQYRQPQTAMPENTIPEIDINEDEIPF
jgi:single-strand DNA-binding protein